MTIHRRPIRSFVRRQGRMTQGQKSALENLWQRYGLKTESGMMSLTEIFGRENPKILDIGFGMGEALLHFAANHPQQDFIGVEVHNPGVGALLMGVEKLQLTNIRVFCADVMEVLQQNLADHSLDGIHLFFPDPWPKLRHHKRRLVQPHFCELLAAKLKPGGYIHMATDWENYAQQMLKVLSATPGLVNQAGVDNFYHRPETRILTRFESRGQRLGHSIWDLFFTK